VHWPTSRARGGCRGVAIGKNLLLSQPHAVARSRSWRPYGAAPGPDSVAFGRGTFWFRVATFGRAERTQRMPQSSVRRERIRRERRVIRAAAFTTARRWRGGAGHGRSRSSAAGHGARDCRVIGWDGRSRPITTSRGRSRRSRRSRRLSRRGRRPGSARACRARGRGLRSRKKDSERASRSVRKVEYEESTGRGKFEGGMGRPVRVRGRRPGRRPPLTPHPIPRPRGRGERTHERTRVGECRCR
jgi:hypothetical protein